MPKINNANGDVSAYGLACGYVDVRKRELESGQFAEFRLSFNGATYDVEVWHGNTTWIELPSGAKIKAGWAQFEKLSDARKFRARIMSNRVKTIGDVYAHCLTVMAW